MAKPLFSTTDKTQFESFSFATYQPTLNRYTSTCPAYIRAGSRIRVKKQPRINEEKELASCSNPWSANFQPVFPCSVPTGPVYGVIHVEVTKSYDSPL